MPEMQTLTEQVDALIAMDDRELQPARAELGRAVLTAGLLAADAVALLALDGRAIEARVAAALYAQLRLARALGIRIESAIVAEIAGQQADRRRLAEHAARAGNAIDRGRG